MNWKQLLGLVRLRYCLSKNQIAKGGKVNAVIFTALFFLLSALAVVSFVSTAYGGAFFLRAFNPRRILFIWNMITLVYLGASAFDFVNRIQQNDAIEIDRLLHLPMTLKGAFVLNYVSSLANLNILVIVPSMLGLAIAMPFARGWPTAIAIPLTLSFIFMVTALMYQLRGWFAELNKNKRTKGWLMILIPFSAIAAFVGVTEFLDANSIKIFSDEFPLGPLSWGLNSANQFGNIVPGLIGTACMLSIGGASLYFAYRKSLKKYTGAVAVSKAASGRAKSTNWEQSSQFKKLPLTSIHASAVALAGMASLRRAPEVFAAIVPAIAAIFLGGPYLIGMDGYDIPVLVRGWLPMIAVFITLIGFPAFLFSTYSYDRDGFRAFVLSPLHRKEILHGKNLAIGIPTVICGWLTLLILQIFVPQNIFWFLGSLVQIPTSYLLLCLVGHSISIFLPIGFKRGSMQPVNAKVIPAIAVYVGVLIGPVIASLPTMLVYSVLQFVESFYEFQTAWIYLLVSLVQLVITWAIYRLCLVPMATWLWRREPEILEVVANIPE